MSNLLAYLEKYFPARLWRPLGVKDAEEEAEAGSSTSVNFGAGADYRRKNHVKSGENIALPSISEGSAWNEEDVRRTFMENFGVSVRIVPDAVSGSGYSSHFLFKYYVILQAKSTWKDDTTGVLGDCRGTILRCDGEEWKLAARPFEKFFNQQEVACPVHTKAEFDKVVQDSEFVEKADGTMMVLWYRRSSASEGRWHWSTSTGLVADSRWICAVSPFLYVPSSTLDTEDFPKDTSNFNLLDENLLDTDLTYVFELCSKETQVITRYETERIYLLGVMSISNPVRFSQTSLDDCAARLKVMRPSRVSAKSQGLTTLEQTLKWVEDQADPANNGGKFGAWPEGFVMYHQDVPLCKLKNRAYVDRHMFYSSDLAHMRRNIVDRYFAGTVDDIVGFCPPPIVAYSEEMTIRVQQLMEVAIKEWKALIEATSKQFESITSSEQRAMVVISTIRESGPKYHHIMKFFLKYKQIFTDDDKRKSESSVREFFIPWLTLNYKSFAEHWKDTDVLELVQEDFMEAMKMTMKRNWLEAPNSSIVALKFDKNDQEGLITHYKAATALLRAGYRMVTTDAYDATLDTKFWKEKSSPDTILQDTRESIEKWQQTNPYISRNVAVEVEKIS